MLKSTRSRLSALGVLGLTAAALLGAAAPLAPARRATTDAYIVQASSADAAAVAVRRAGGTVTGPLGIIHAVAADLDQAALARLQADPALALHRDAIVRPSVDGLDPAQLAPLGQADPLKDDQDDDQDDDRDDNETGTRNRLLHPSVATGASDLHRLEVPTQNYQCAGQQVGLVQPSTVQRPLQGWGVTVAVLDSGFIKLEPQDDDQRTWHDRNPDGTLFAYNEGRCLIYRDFLDRDDSNDKNNSIDQNGHGTHVISTIADNREKRLSPDSNEKSALGVAPKVNVLAARVLDKDGTGTYSRVITAIDWVVANKQAYNVRVLNLSLYAPVNMPYWADPLNQAVMRAWQAGIVVVAAAGNSGSDAGTITVPGNNPYVISVGAIKSGRYTASDYDELATYSSRGPTESAFVKPDLLVPASQTIAPIPDGSTLARLVPEAVLPDPDQTNVDYGIGRPDKNHAYFRLSGTSMAAAEISGVVALIIQANPSLSNDQIKHRLLSTARPALDETSGAPIYSSWEQGAGLLDAEQAVFTTTVGLANRDMNIAIDLDTTSAEQTHYWGSTRWNAQTASFELVDPQTGQVLEVWAGKSQVWAGKSQVWAGKSQVWAGKSQVWAGTQLPPEEWGTDWAEAWTDRLSLWAGKSQVWAGSKPPEEPEDIEKLEFRSETVVTDEPQRPLCDAFCVALPLVVQ